MFWLQALQLSRPSLPQSPIRQLSLTPTLGRSYVPTGTSPSRLSQHLTGEQTPMSAGVSLRASGVRVNHARLFSSIRKIHGLFQNDALPACSVWRLAWSGATAQHSLLNFCQAWGMEQCACVISVMSLLIVQQISHSHRLLTHTGKRLDDRNCNNHRVIALPP